MERIIKVEGVLDPVSGIALLRRGEEDEEDGKGGIGSDGDELVGKDKGGVIQAEDEIEERLGEEEGDTGRDRPIEESRLP